MMQSSILSCRSSVDVISVHYVLAVCQTEPCNSMLTLYFRLASYPDLYPPPPPVNYSLFVFKSRMMVYVLNFQLTGF